MELIPVGIFWSIAFWALFQKKQVLMYLFFASMPFGSFAAIPTVLTAGLTLTPTPIVALLLISRELGNVRGLTNALDIALKPFGLLLLFLFWLVGAIATAFMPRFFAGVQIVPMRYGISADTVALAPTIQNLSQFVYISISVLTVFAFASMLRSESMRRHVLVALCLGATLTVLTGFLDFVAPYLRIESVLEVFRTASYALLTEDEILNSKRVVGLMPEASSFGSLSLSFLTLLYFFRRAMPVCQLRNRIVPVLMGLLLLFVWISTSSAAYLGLGIFAITAIAEWCWRLAVVRHNLFLRRDLAIEFWMGIFVIWALLLILIAMPQAVTPMLEMFNVMVLQKSGTSSFEERSMWTQVSWNALLSTHGLGVGLGGTRASNFAVALLSNAGILGAGLYFLFVMRCLLIGRTARHDAEGAAMLSAVRWSYLPAFIVSLTIGTTPDFGVLNAFLYGLAVALAHTDSNRDHQQKAVQSIVELPLHRATRFHREQYACEN
jgi:hypothetical protein